MNYYSGNTYQKKNNGIGLVLLFISILLIISGFVLMNTNLLSDVKKVETVIDKKVVYTNDEQVIKVKVSTKKDTKPVVKFKSKNGNIKFSETIQQGEEVETKIIGSNDGEDTIVVEVETENGKRGKKEEIELTVCNKPKIINTSDKTLNIKEDNTINLKFNVSSVCLEDYEIYVENTKIAELDDNYNLFAKKSGATNLILKRNKDIIKYSVNVKPSTISVKSVRIDNKSFNLAVGKTKELYATVLPKDATNREVTYESSDPNIIEVSEDGVVKAVGVGTATVKVSSKSDTNKKAQIKIKVYKNQETIEVKKEEISSILFENISYSLEENETKNLVVNITPKEKENKTITCKSLNEKVATVTASNNTCVVKGISNGTTIIEARVQGSTKKTTAKLIVNKPLASVTSLKFDSNKYLVYEGETKDFVVEILPNDAKDKTITCVVDDTSVAEVTTNNNACVIKGIKKGNVTLTVTSSNNKKTTAIIEVTNRVVKVTSLKFEQEDYSIYEGETANFEVTINPSDTTNKTITCTSSDNAVAEVSASNNTCVVKGVKSGKITLTAKSAYGNTTTTDVTVNKRIVSVESLKFSQNDYSIYEDESKNIEVTINPSDAKDKTITCTGSDNTIAEVSTSNNTCVVKGIKSGKITLTVTSKDGDKKATTEVKINKKVVSVESLKFYRDNYSIYEGESENLEVTINPSDAKDKTITCTSSDDTVAKVSTSNNTCAVKGIKSGNVTITAISKDGGKKATTSLTVNKKVVSVENIKFNSDKYTLYEEETKNLVVEVSPIDAANKAITCTGSDDTVAKVSTSNNTCVVKGIKSGNVTITATSKDGGKKATIGVTINAKAQEAISISSLKFNQDTYSIYEGESKSIEVTIFPSNATNKAITCTTSNKAIATATASNNICMVKGIKNGTVTIIAESKDGKKATATLKVSKKTVDVTSLNISTDKYSIYEGEQKNIVVEVLPSNATNKKITCTSSNKAAATVMTSNNTCVVKGIKEGTTTITAKSNNGKTVTATVTVSKKTVAVSSVRFSTDKYSLYEGETKNLVTEVLPANASNKTITCSTSDKNVVTVTTSNNTCVVKGVKAGKATITATSNNGKKATIAVIVTTKTVAVTRVRFNTDKYSLYEDEIKNLVAEVLPANASNKTITCSTSDKNVVTVTTSNNTCVAKGVKAGKATITATSNNGKKATIAVTVTAKTVAVTSVKFATTKYSLFEGETKNLAVEVLPVNASNKTITCSTSDKNVAIVTTSNNTCVVKGVKAGKATITAKSNNGKTTTATVIVSTKTVAVTSVEFTKKDIKIVKGKSVNIEVKILPANASNKTITCTSDKPTIVTASAQNNTCLVTGVGSGTAKITVKSNNGKTAATTVTSNIPVEKLAFKETSYEVQVGEKKSLPVTVTPSDATNKKITCTTSDKTIATVVTDGSNCMVSGVKSGAVTISAKNSDGTIKATTKVTVKSKNPEAIKVTDIKFSSESYSINSGDTKTLTPVITPNNATNKDVTCKSTNPKAATVTAKGGSCVVTGVACCGTYIEATTKDGSKTAKVKINVSTRVKSIKFEESSYTIAYNESKALVLGITPSDATNKSITCKSLNTKVVTVTYKGNTCTVKGVAPGTAKIEAYSADGNKKATTSIKVSPIAVKSIKFEKSSYSVNIGSKVTPVVKFTPSNASDQVITCTTSDKNVATVSAKGTSCEVKGVKAGSVTITATSKDGSKTAKTTVKVNAISVTGIKFASTDYKIEVGKTLALTPTVSPSDATNKTYTCKSDNTEVATITSTCTVKGVKAGTAKITATTKDGSKTATATITVKSTIKKEKIKVATFNMGGGYCGSYYDRKDVKPRRCSEYKTYKNWEGNYVSEVTNESFIDFIKTNLNDVTIIGYQEGLGRRIETVREKSGFKYGFYGKPWNTPEGTTVSVHGVMSKIKYDSSEKVLLKSGHEQRYYDKAIYTINGVKVSFYNIHVGLRTDTEKHFKILAEIVAKDPNVIIMTADWNYSKIDLFNNNFVNQGFSIAAYDTSKNNMWKSSSYCDSILIRDGKTEGHISKESFKVVQAFDIVTDHNVVVAELSIYK